MKKSESVEPNKTRQSRAGGVGGKAAPKAKGIKLSVSRRPEPAGLLEEHFSDSGTPTVCFEYFNPEAGEVLVAGSFNGWQPQATPMTRQREGRWFTEIPLPAGEYEYRFVVDGQWRDDPMAARFVANSFGGLNGVVEVKPKAASAGGNR